MMLCEKLGVSIENNVKWFQLFEPFANRQCLKTAF